MPSQAETQAIIQRISNLNDTYAPDTPADKHLREERQARDVQQRNNDLQALAAAVLDLQERAGVPAS